MGESTKLYCPECCLQFPTESKLMLHRRVTHLRVRYHCCDCINCYTKQNDLTLHRINFHPEKVSQKEREEYEHQEIQNLKHVIVAASAKLRAKISSQQPFSHQRAATGAQRARSHRPPVVRQFLPPITGPNRRNQLATTYGVNVNPSRQTPSANLQQRIGPDQPTKKKIGETMAPATTVLSMLKSPLMSLPAGPTSTIVAGPTSTIVAGPTATASAHIVATSQLVPTSRRPNVSSVVATSVSKTNSNRCQLCPFSATNTDGFKLHRRKHCKDHAKGHRCSFCNYSVESMPSLMMHTPVHFSATSISTAAGVIEALPALTDASCTFCGRRFTSVQNLFNHERLHTV